VLINLTLLRAGEGGINSVPIQSRKGSQVEQEPCDTLYGRMDGSDPISSKIHPEGNASGNITIISDQVLAQPWPKGYGPSIYFALSIIS